MLCPPLDLAIVAKLTKTEFESVLIPHSLRSCLRAKQLGSSMHQCIQIWTAFDKNLLHATKLTVLLLQHQLGMIANFSQILQALENVRFVILLFLQMNFCSICFGFCQFVPLWVSNAFHHMLFRFQNLANENCLYSWTKVAIYNDKLLRYKAFLFEFLGWHISWRISNDHCYICIYFVAWTM